MSILNDIKILLDIQDKNIIFEENGVYIKNYKGSMSKFVSAKLTYTPTHCEKCGVKNDHYTIYKNGTKTSHIKLPMFGAYPTYLSLKKQRFFCKTCDKTFIAHTSIVDRHCFISKNTKAKILIKSTDAQSLTDIAKDCSVSTTTVQRVINQEAKRYRPYYQSLPDHLSFDEFKYAKGKMAFEYVDAETGNIIDILDNRISYKINEHFIGNYERKTLNKVKTVSIDMNAGYVSVIKEVFPKAQIIIDRFHIVQLINRAMNMTRVRIMNSFRTSNNEDMKKYRRLKRYWKLLLKRRKDLSYTEYKFYPMFGQRLEASIVEELLSYSDQLKITYEIYQSLSACIADRCFNRFKDRLLSIRTNTLSKQMKTAVNTLKKHLPYIKNSLKYPYNNGRIEGINNKIKVLNRVAYGYRNFHYFKNRIILHFKLRAIVRQKESSCSVS